MKKENNNTATQLIVLAILLLGLAGVLFVERNELPLLPGRPNAAAPPVVHAPQAGGPVAKAEPERPVEEIHESPDTETPLERLIPRSSVGHSQGLNRVRDPLRLGSSAAVVVDAATKQVLYGKNEEAVLPIASITKLMTGLVTVESHLPMDDTVTITEDDVDHERNSRSRMRVGAVLTRAEALRLALMSSENRAAHALGRTYPGGMTAFVAAMNRKARQLGMTHTTYVEPTGLSEKNQSTARDLATLVLAASSYPVLREYTTTPEHRTVVANRVLEYHNSDPLLKDPDWVIQLQKTGYIIEAGHCVVLRTRADGREVAMVVLDADGNRTRSVDARRMREFVELGADENAIKMALSETPKHRVLHPQAKKAEKKAAVAKAKMAEGAKKSNGKRSEKTKQAARKQSDSRKQASAKSARSKKELAKKPADAKSKSKHGRVHAEFAQHKDKDDSGG
jgi:D-alanyl-D-alanine endopeptidase (penicillin-binding protein 7)